MGKLLSTGFHWCPEDRVTLGFAFRDLRGSRETNSDSWLYEGLNPSNSCGSRLCLAFRRWARRFRPGLDRRPPTGRAPTPSSTPPTLASRPRALCGRVTGGRAASIRAGGPPPRAGPQGSIGGGGQEAAGGGAWLRPGVGRAQGARGETLGVREGSKRAPPVGLGRLSLRASQRLQTPAASGSRTAGFLGGVLLGDRAPDDLVHAPLCPCSGPPSWSRPSPNGPSPVEPPDPT